MEAAISHKLMNPLNSLSHQLDELREVIDDLHMLKQRAPSKIRPLNLNTELNNISDRITSIERKSYHSYKLIEYWLHDTQDFDTLKNNPLRFDKKICVFDIRDAINEISDML